MKPKPDAPPFSAVFLIPCPTCGAAVGFTCQDVDAGMHHARVRAAVAGWTKK